MEGGGHGQCAWYIKILLERLRNFKVKTVLFTKQQKDHMGDLGINGRITHTCISVEGTQIECKIVMLDMYGGG